MPFTIKLDINKFYYICFFFQFWKNKIDSGEDLPLEKSLTLYYILSPFLIKIKINTAIKFY